MIKTRKPGFLIALFSIFAFAGLAALFTVNQADASTQGEDAVLSPFFAPAVSSHGNIDFSGRTQETFQYSCTTCHDSHGGTGNLATIRRSYVIVNMSPFTMSGPVIFTALTGPNSFDDGVSAETSRICVTCHVNANRPGAATSMSHTGGYDHASGSDYSGQDCTTCHSHDPDGDPATIDGFMPSGGACNSCHGAPPATGSHSVHSNPAAVPTVYGETGANSTPTAYDFSCGECHPTDVSMHRNGTVDVVLTSTGAPVGSLKVQNTVGASYDPATQTCGGAYCHSGERVAPTGPVGWPLVDGTGQPILDSHNNPTYAPYTSSTYREYASPVWGASLPDNGGPEGTCDACHQFPLTTSFRDGVMGGAVDSHQWISPDVTWGGTWGTLHAYSYMAQPIPCRACHYQTVTTHDSLTNAQRFVTNSFGDNIAVFGALPIADRAYHVNGNQDVAFDTVDTVGFYSNSGLIQMPVAGTYFPAQKSCGNVSCHGSNLPALIGKDIGGQNYVVWGSPYHIYESPTLEGCEFCHRPGGYSGKWYPVLAACNTCHPAMTYAPNAPGASIAMFRNTSLASFKNGLSASHKGMFSLPADHPSGACTGCHTPHMTDAASDPRTWTMDKIPPETHLDSGPADPSASAAATFAFSSTDVTATFECSLDASAFSVCASIQSYSRLSDGMHTFKVRAKDPAGNVDATPAFYVWTVDTLPPDTQIITSPDNPSFVSAASFNFTSPDATATFECSLNGSPFSACASPKSFSGLAQGAYTFEVRAKDAVGNLDSSPAAFTWNIYKVITVTYTSSAVKDGWILGAGKAHSEGRVMSAAGFLHVGGTAGNQFRSILDFNTADLPDNAVIVSATVQVRRVGPIGRNTFPKQASLLGDMKKGFLGTSDALQLMDFDAPASSIGRFIGIEDNWYQLEIAAPNLQYINLTGATQFRMKMAGSDGKGANFATFYSGDSAKDKPFLTVQYYLP